MTKKRMRKAGENLNRQRCEATEPDKILILFTLHPSSKSHDDVKTFKVK